MCGCAMWYSNDTEMRVIIVLEWMLGAGREQEVRKCGGLL
jgi:hypothetical protein